MRYYELPTDIKNCPFCGEVPVMRDDTSNVPFSTQYFGVEIGCGRCNIFFKEPTEVLPELMSAETLDVVKQRLIHKWNRRFQ